jgi:hypothetical protein
MEDMFPTLRTRDGGERKYRDLGISHPSPHLTTSNEGILASSPACRALGMASHRAAAKLDRSTLTVGA